MANDAGSESPEDRARLIEELLRQVLVTKELCASHAATAEVGAGYSTRDEQQQQAFEECLRLAGRALSRGTKYGAAIEFERPAWQLALLSSLATDTLALERDNLSPFQRRAINGLLLLVGLASDLGLAILANPLDSEHGARKAISSQIGSATRALTAQISFDSDGTGRLGIRHAYRMAIELLERAHEEYHAASSDDARVLIAERVLVGIPALLQYDAGAHAREQIHAFLTTPPAADGGVPKHDIAVADLLRDAFGIQVSRKTIENAGGKRGTRERMKR